MFKKRILSAVLVLMLIFSSVSMVSVFAADTANSVLTWDVIKNGQIKTDVTKNLNLVNSIILNGEEVAVDWSSSDPAVISEDGVVTRDYENKAVTLTATAGASKVTFNVTVPSYMQGNVVEEYSHDFEDYALGADVNGDLFRVTYVNDKGAEFKVTKDYVTGTEDKVMYMDIIGGSQQMTSADKNLCTKDITYTGTFYNGKEQATSKSYTWKVLPERQQNSIGYYYRGYRTDIAPSNKNYWAGVYVDENDNVIPEYVFTYGSVTYITNDGSPYLPKVLLTNNGNPRPVTMDIATVRPQERGGVYAYSFRFGMRKYNDDGTVRNINGFTDKPELKIVADGAYFTFDYTTGGTQTNGFYQGRIAGTKMQGSEVKVHIDNNGNINNGIEAQYVGKTADMKGIYDNTDNFDHIKLPTPGEWADVQFVYDMSNLTATLYFNGKPVFFRAAGASGNVYSSIIDMTYGRGGNYMDPPRIQIYDNQSVYADKEFMFDDYSVKTFSAAEQAEAILNDVADNPYIRYADNGTKLILESKDNVTYSVAEEDAEKVTINNGVATINASVGFGTETVTLKATATKDATTVNYGDNNVITSIDPNTVTVTKDIVITVNKKNPYEVISVSMSNEAGSGAYAPLAGTTINTVNIRKNIDHVASDVYIAAYDAEGVLTSIIKRPIPQDGVVQNINLQNATDASYNLFVIERATFKPLTLKTVSLKADDAVKVFTLGDQDGKIAASINDKFDVTVDTTYATATAKGALTQGGLDYVLDNAEEGDYVVVNLSRADYLEVTADEYEILLTQIVKAAKAEGIIPVLVFSYENSAYFNKSIAVSSACGVAVTSGIVAIDVGTQIKNKCLPINKFAK